MTLSAGSSSNSVIYPVKNQFPLIARVDAPYEWSISDKTFTDSSNVVATQIPPWLSYANLTFTGMPTDDDEGTFTIVLSAGGVKDKFTILVTSDPIPVVNIPLEQQFNASNPSLSSVFLLHNNSALSSSVPALRVPPNWSFSVGLQGDTFVPGISNSTDEDDGDGDDDDDSGNVYYSALQADGTPLPYWLTFNPDTITFDGVTKAPPNYDPDRTSVVFIASDQQGYSAVIVPFDIIVASHELWSEASQPVWPINATLGEPLDFSFQTDDWVLDGVMLNNRSINASSITSLSVGTSGYTWLEYDSGSFTLSGTPPTSSDSESSGHLPIAISASNETLSVEVPLMLLPSYFTDTSLKPSFAMPGTDLDIPLQTYITSDLFYQQHPIDLNATFDPSTAGSYFRISNSSGLWSITGTVPTDLDYSDVNVTITSYDHITHTSSHITGLITFSKGSRSVDPTLTLAKKRKLSLALGIAFGVVGGFVAFFGLIAFCKKYCEAKDTAIDPYANEKTFVLEPDVEGYGWTEKLGLGFINGKDKELQLTTQPVTEVGGARFMRVESPLHRIPSRLTSPFQGLRSPYAGLGGIGSPGMMPKGAFFTNVKKTIRKISNAGSRRSWKKSAISRPVLMLTSDSNKSVESKNLPAPPEHAYQTNFANVAASNIALAGSLRSVNAVEGDGVSIGMNSSPASSTGPNSARSVPRQRPDFGPSRGATLGAVPPLPATLPPTRKRSKGHSRMKSTDSQHSQTSGDVEEAVIVTASRAPSIRSAHSSYSYSGTPEASTFNATTSTSTRPRLVQFTSAKGVPVPVPSIPGGYNGNNPNSKERRTSQIAHIFTNTETVVEAAQNDAILKEGMRYVRAFGNQNEDLEPTYPPNLSESKFKTTAQQNRSRPPSLSTNTKSLSPSLHASSRSHSPITTQSSYIYPSPSASFDSVYDASRPGVTMPRIVVAGGGAFAFKFPVAVTGSKSKRRLHARPLHGNGKLPHFLNYSHTPSTTTVSDRREEIDFWGTPGPSDLGEVMVGVFDERDQCVGRIIVDVVGK